MPNAQLRDIVMYYEEAGSGDPLVLVMGLSADSQAWGLQVPSLAKHFRVITFDNRGVGRTSAPDRPYTVAGMAGDLAGLLDHLGIQKAHILGLSLGGYVAQEFALKYPARVEKLILVSTGPRTDGYTGNIIKSWINVRRSNMSREQTVRLTSCWLYSPALLNDEARFERGIQNSLANPYAQLDHAFIRQANAVLAFDAGDRLAGLKAKTLVVAGEDDILTPSKLNAEVLAKVLPGAELKVLPGGHLGCLEHPNEYNETFLAFLQHE